MSLGVVLLVDLDHTADRINFFAVCVPDILFHGAGLPVRIDRFTEFLYVFFVYLKAVLRPGRKIFKLPVHPRTAALGKDHAGPHAFCAVTDNEFFRINGDFHFLKRSLECQRPLLRS